MKFEEIEISIQEKQQGRVKINGMPLNGVQTVNFSFGVNQMPTVSLEIVTDALILNGSSIKKETASE